MEFGLLGTISVSHDGQDLGPSGVQRRFVLAALLLEPGRIVPVDRLVDELWGEDAPKTARNIIQGCVADLRRTFAVDPAVRLTHRSPGYLVEVDPQRVDLVRFRDLVVKARQTQDVVLFRQALGLWRGEPLADVPGLVAVKQALAEERLSVLEECLDLEVRTGNPPEVVSELRLLVDAHPLRERLHGLLMQALHVAGRPGDAAQAFANARAVLRDELGADPGPELRRLHEQILRGEGGSGVVPRQLPPAPAAFTGRAAELAELAVAPAARTTVISAIGGLGGIGKTSLALHWAHRNLDRYPDGQLFVDLNGFDPGGEPMPPEVAVRGFLEALGVKPNTVPVDPHAQAALYRSLVADKRMLIVLDNARDSAHVRSLLPGSPGCTVLITSRDRMHGLATTHGGRTLHLGTLSDREARDLVVSRLGAHRVDREPGAVAEILACCAGVPLALGIVAGRAAAHPDFPLAALAAELRDARMAALDTGDPATDLAAVLSCSHAALSPDQARAFELLGQAPGPDIGLAATAGLLGLAATEARKVLRGLEQVSLVDEHRPGRYRMHDLVRLHVSERAAPDRAARRRLVDFYLHTAFAARRRLNPDSEPVAPEPAAASCNAGSTPPDKPTAMSWFDREHANLLAVQELAAAEGWHTAVWQLAWTMYSYHYHLGRFADELAVWQRGLAAAEQAGDPAARGLAHRSLGHACGRLSRQDEALDHLTRALARYGDAGDVRGQAHTHEVLAAHWEQRGDIRRALDEATRARHFLRGLGNPLMEAHSLNAMAWYESNLGDHTTARAHAEEALTLFRRQRSHAAGDTLDTLGFIALRTGRHNEAVGYFHEALALHRDSRNVHQEAGTLDRLGQVRRELGDHALARENWRQALELYEQQGRKAAAERLRRALADL
ncbi:BTAD domain-containing putative transcriptional regulator [Actinosynnema sp. CS-041913]|uniref:AfsR/SARP family transcriptional regulator n=1 Tax=Actinosynnema sp. CS-041913 TaxID=3239917 RepID=UPI003D94220D